METSQRHIQDRLGSVLQRLARIEQRASISSDTRAMQTLLKECRLLVADLEQGFSRVQEATLRQAELRREVEAASRRAGLLFELSTVPCLIVNAAGTIVEANSAATRILNTSLRHLHGKSFELFLAGERTVFLDWLQQVALGAEDRRCPVVLRPRERSAKRLVVLASPEQPDRIALILSDAVQTDKAGSPPSDALLDSPAPAN